MMSISKPIGAVTLKSASMQKSSRFAVGQQVRVQSRSARFACGGRSSRLICRAAEWSDPDFAADVLRRFPEDGVANTEEAMVLLRNGYEWLDIRTKAEREEGFVLQSKSVPIIEAVKRWDSDAGEKVFKDMKKNENFVNEVRKIFPDTSTRIIIQCSDGRKRALAALMALDDAGYSNIVGLKGGFNAWSLKFDNKLNRRMPIDGYKVCAVWHTTMRGTMAVLWS
eukprot:scaffold619_cov403-Prasinococcus_capsulatus_cf.AAC.11